MHITAIDTVLFYYLYAITVKKTLPFKYSKGRGVPSISTIIYDA